MAERSEVESISKFHPYLCGFIMVYLPWTPLTAFRMGFSVQKFYKIRIDIEIRNRCRSFNWLLLSNVLYFSVCL